jgi:beta-lactamase regulating signal transducer with metallopeptidase domain
MWAIPFLRLWMLFGISSRLSVMSLLSDRAVRTVTVYEPLHLSHIVSANFVQAADSYFPITYKTNLLASVFSVSTIIWLVGCCTVVLTATLLYIFTLSEMKKARHLRGNIYVSDRVTAPALYGIIKPRIIIPAYMENDDLTYIVLHETAHAARRDNIFRCLAILTAALHWYNPLVWLMLRRYFEDLELACDERVITHMNTADKREYAHALVHAAESRSAFVSAFGGAKIRVRIENILSYRAATAFSLAALLVFATAVAVTLLTNAVV